MTSGTLAYSFGLGKPVVSTPYWHAQELLADGRGVLVPFGDTTATGNEIAELLTDDPRRQAMSKRAHAVGRTMTWERTAERYMLAFENARQGHSLRVISGLNGAELPSPHVSDDQIGHFLSMCDDTGLFQHAVHTVPDRAHGYCVDDNARALLLACALNNPGEQRLPDVLTARFAAFVQHAWNPDTRRFRNFMGFNRTWLENSGSEDSHGRTLWALGECARSDASLSRRRWATALFAEALPADGKLWCCDVSEQWTGIARRYWKEAGVESRIELTIAPALKTLDGLLAQGLTGQLDLAFIDANKDGYDAYYERCLKLVRRGGIVLIDNVLWGGSVANLADKDADTQAIRALNAKLKADERVDLALFAVGDGMTCALKR